MQQQTNTTDRIATTRSGLLMAVAIGLPIYIATEWLQSPLVDPLVIAIIAGAIVRTGIGDRTALHRGLAVAPSVFIPIGLVFYAMRNFNCVSLGQIQPGSLPLVGLVLLAYFTTVLTLGRLLRQRDRITYLTAAGSAICGASAITITSQVVKADSDDMSVSILAVTSAAVVALFTFIPFVTVTFGMDDQRYGLLSGAVLQLTGFVKAAAMNPLFLSRRLSDKELVSFALSIKAARYVGLLIAMPLFASLVRRRLCFPPALWLFLGAGLFGMTFCATHKEFYATRVIPAVKPVYELSWSIAMAAVGLNADVRTLLSNNGAKALIMAFAGCIAAIATFIAGSMILGQF